MHVGVGNFMLSHDEHENKFIALCLDPIITYWLQVTYSTDSAVWSAFVTLSTLFKKKKNPASPGIHLEHSIPVFCKLNNFFFSKLARKQVKIFVYFGSLSAGLSVSN